MERSTTVLTLVLGTCIVAATAASCSSPSGPRGEDLGVARIALSAVPADVQCLEVVALGGRRVTKRFSLLPDASVLLEMAGLPLGAVQFSGAAFDQSCGASSTLTPTWISDVSSATLVRGVLAEVTLNMRRNGRASIHIDFEDQNQGAGGAAGTGGGPPDAGAGGGSGAGMIDSGAAGQGGGVPVCGQPSTDYVWSSVTDPGTPTTIQAIAGEMWGISGFKLQRWNGSTWTTASTDIPYLPRNLLRGSAASDVWVVSDVSRVFRWDGSSFADVTPPSLRGPVLDLQVINPSDAWLVKSYLRDDLVQVSEVQHWDGAIWNLIALPADLPAKVDLRHVWITAPNDVWIRGYGAEVNSWSGLLLHWDGTALQRISFGVPGDLSEAVGAVWGTSPTDVWVSHSSSYSQTLNGLLHYDGTVWTRAFRDLYFEEMWGNCATDVWGMSAAGIWHFDGTSWSEARDKPTTGVSLAVGTMSGTGPDDVWISSSPPSRWQKDVCGNGIIGLGETCEPPDRGAGLDPACDHSCHIPSCGNLVVDPGETCDPPNRTASSSTPACDQSCQIPSCGNLIVDPGETCDPPNRSASSSTPACDQSCQIPTCGNLAVDPGETCDPPNNVTCRPDCETIPTVCGNGIVQPGEACDPPNAITCDQQCQTIPQCGDCAIGAETCDPTTFGPIFCVAGTDGCGHWGPPPLRNGCTGQWFPGCQRATSPFYCYWDSAGCRVQARCPDGMFCPSESANCIPQP